MTDPIPPSRMATTAATPSPADRDRLHKAAQAFEAIFVRQMLSNARATNFGDTLWGTDQGQETWSGLRDERFADILAQAGTLGLGRQIEAQLAAQSAPAAPAVQAGTRKDTGS